MDQRIIIEIQNNVKVQSSPSSTPRQNLNNTSNNNGSQSQPGIPSMPNNQNQFANGKFDRLISAEFIARTVQKVANATGNEEVIKISSAIGKAVKYGNVALDALSGNYVSLAITAIELAAKVFEEWCNEQREKAEEQNNVDLSRINAGLMDMSNVKVSTNFWGRYVYSGK